MNTSEKQISKTRLTFFIIFSILIVACVILAFITPSIDVVDVEWFNESLFQMASVGLVFLMSLCLLKINKKSLFVTISLIAYCVVAYFLFSLANFSNTADEIDLARKIMLYSMLAQQLIIAIYTILLSKGAGLKVLNIAARVALSLVAYFVLTETLPEYFDLENSLFAIYLVNALITFVVLCFSMKKHFLMAIGTLIATAGAVFYAFSFGWVALFGITGEFVKFISSFNIAYLLSIIGIYLLGCDAVFSGIFKTNRPTTL